MDAIEWRKKQWIYKDNINIIQGRLNKERLSYGTNIKYINCQDIAPVIIQYAKKHGVDIISASEQVKRIIGKEKTNIKFFELIEELRNNE